VSTYGALPAGLARSALLDAVRATLHGALEPRAAVVLAVSGGPDSTALAYLVTEARPDLRAVVGHVRHGLRDDAEDARVAAAHARALGVEHRERSVAVEVAGDGPEAAARQARYAALQEIATKVGATAILTGHTADDQAETVLLNIARGTGLRGLAGMPAVRPGGEGAAAIVRPLLRLRRVDVRGFVTGEGLVAVADPTNADLRGRRNRTRNLLLPALGALGGGSGDPVGVLSRLADLARQDADHLDALAADRARELIVPWGPTCAVRLEPLRALPPALATRVVRLALGAVRGQLAGIGADMVAEVLALRPGRAAQLGAATRATCGGGWLAVAPTDLPGLAQRPVPLPGTATLPELGAVLHADRAGAGQARLPLPDEEPPPPPGPWIAPPGADVPAWAVLPETGPLMVRSRRPGERIELPGGTRKLQDVFVDAGVPRALRALVPVVADEQGTAWWVPGLAVRASDRPPAVRLWLSPAEAGALRSGSTGGLGIPRVLGDDA
jgi:tRNA(Ile)-lysidine synthase